MINNLALSKNAQFFKLKKPLTKLVVSKVFKKISEKRVGNYLIREVRASHKVNYNDIAYYSVLSYKFEVEPSFLQDTAIKEQKYAYLLLVELQDALVVFKKYIDSPEKYLARFIEEYEYESLSNLYSYENPKYERVTMKNMSIANTVIRARSLEANNLDGILPSNISSRSIPSSFRMSTEKGSFALTPNTSRVSCLDKKASLEDIIEWAFKINEEIKSTTQSSGFINNFATSVCLHDILAKGHRVVAILFDLSEIEDKISSGEITLKDRSDSHLNQNKIEQLFRLAKNPLFIENNRLKIRWITLSNNVTYSKNLITLRSEVLNLISIEKSDGSRTTLGSYINQNKPFSAVFDSPNYAYFSRASFEDKRLLNSLQSILNIFDDSCDFEEVESEKEKPHNKNLQAFPEKSLFRVIEDEFSSKNNVLICDDMGDEWADHIAINTESSPPSVAFIHSKYVKKETYGASAFHEVISQALKNIGRTQESNEGFKKKYNQKWSKKYEKTKISRIKGAESWQELEEVLNKVNIDPNSIKKIILATPFLRKTTLKEELMKVAKGEVAKPHYVQLIWLINTFISACQDFGVQAHILCKK